MTQPYPYLALADALDTITIMSGTATPGEFSINRRVWAPQIASLRVSALGGQGAYQEVVEEFDLNVTGATVAAAYANLERLNRLLDRAERWQRAEFVDASFGGVQLRYSPQGSTASSTASYLCAIVLGRAPGDTTRAPVELPPTFTEAGITRHVLAVRLRLWRRGRWLAPASGTFASASTANGAVMACGGITAHATMSPVHTLFLGSFNSASNPTISPGIIAVGGMTTDVIRAEDMSGATAAGYTTQADVANLPRNGAAVLRYTPAGTAAASSGWTPSPGVQALSTSPVAVIAVVRNNHASRVFQVRVDLRGFGVTVTTPYATVEAGGNVPQIVRLGIVRHPYLFDQVRVTCVVDSASGSPTLDIDTVYLVALHNEMSRVIQHAAIDISALAAGSVDLGIRVQQETSLTPIMQVEGVGSRAIATYYDPIDLEMLGTVYNVCWISTRAQYWRFTTTAGAVVSLTAGVRRSTAYLGPQ